ncbi:MAG: hypothetical protein ACRDZ4_20875 [Egibacteraceae bacterium]
MDLKILGILVALLIAEFIECGPWLAERLICWSARRLPDPEATARYKEEWLADLRRVPGKLTPLCFAIGIVLRLPRMRRTLATDKRTHRLVAGVSHQPFAGLDIDPLASLSVALDRGLVVALSHGLVVGLVAGLSYGLIVGLVVGLSYAMLHMLVFGLVHMVNRIAQVVDSLPRRAGMHHAVDERELEAPA